MLTVDECGDAVLLLGSERRQGLGALFQAPEAGEAAAFALPSSLRRRRQSWLPRAPVLAAGATLLLAGAACCWVALAGTGTAGGGAWPAGGTAVPVRPREVVGFSEEFKKLEAKQDGDEAAYEPPVGPEHLRASEDEAPEGHGREREDADGPVTTPSPDEIKREPGEKKELMKDAADYQVVFEGHIHIRKEKDTESDVLGDLWKCTVFKAVDDGDWVKLVDTEGYIIKEAAGATLVKPIPIYYRMKQGSCHDIHGAHPIMDKHTCELAAAAMMLPDTNAKHVDSIPSPEGCYLKDGKSLWLADKSEFSKPQAMDGRELICSSYEAPVHDCMPVTTTKTTTEAPEEDEASQLGLDEGTKHFPSLFCWSVVRASGYETPLVRRQMAEKASIFACDDYAVLCNGGKVWLKDDWYAAEIPVPEVGMGNLAEAGVTTNSWLNTEIFMVAWDLIRQDGRFSKHDWTVKADPDAVLFPWRLRQLVFPHTPKPPSRTPPEPPLTDMLFFLNCNRAPPTPPGKPQLFGAVEVFSRAALLAYYYSSVKNGADCKKELKWHGWGEDSYMQHCMFLIGAQAVQEFGWVADDRCIPGACNSPAPSAFHDFKGEGEWFNCWNQGLAVVPRPADG